MKALILVDLQNDFCPGGNLPIPQGDEVIAVANHLQPHFDLVIATQDWHPQDHMSFASNHPGHDIGDAMAYARGIDMVNVAYHYLDLVPKGRDEGNKGPSWLRRHDEYGRP